MGISGTQVQWNDISRSSHQETWLQKMEKKVKRVLHRDLLDDMAPATEDDQAEKMEEVDEGTKLM